MDTDLFSIDGMIEIVQLFSYVSKIVSINKKQIELLTKRTL